MNKQPIVFQPRLAVTPLAEGVTPIGQTDKCKVSAPLPYSGYGFVDEHGRLPLHVQGIREFFKILDTIEESDEGSPWHPTWINCARALEIPRLTQALDKMRTVLLAHKENQL